MKIDHNQKAPGTEAYIVRSRLILRFFITGLLLLVLSSHGAAALNATFNMIGQNNISPYSYYRIEIQNPNSYTMEYDFRILSYNPASQNDMQNQKIDGFKTKIYNIPLFHNNSQARVEIIDSDGDRISLHSNKYHNQIFLHICPLGSLWLSEMEMVNFSNEFNIISGTRAMSSPGVHCVSQVEPKELPDNWLCYTPFNAIAVSESVYKGIEPEVKSAMLKWVETGGQLCIYGNSEEKEESRVFGKISFTSVNPIKAGIVQSDWRHPVSPWQKFFSSHQRSSRIDFPYTIDPSGGRGVSLIIATLFFIIAGPVNYIYFYRRNRIRMLLISLPVISIAFCLLISAQFLVTQGFTRKGGTVSITVLNENTDSAFTYATHTLLSGLYPLGGFKFDYETAFFHFGINAQQDTSNFNITKCRNLASGLFKPSVNFNYFTAKPFKTRERLIYNRDEGIIINGFNSDILELVIKDGDKYYSTGELKKGDKAELKLEAEVNNNQRILKKLKIDDDINIFFNGYMSDFLSIQADSGNVIYHARLKDSPPSIESGVRIKSGNHSAVLIGLMDMKDL